MAGVEGGTLWKEPSEIIICLQPLSQQFFANFLNKIIEDEKRELASAFKKDVSNFKLFFVPWESVENISSKLKYNKSICWVKTYFSY